jgi:hypothetical protein
MKYCMGPWADSLERERRKIDMTLAHEICRVYRTGSLTPLTQLQEKQQSIK